jgi:predicted  nucleic acid-binding Zn-ribbon protein
MAKMTRRVEGTGEITLEAIESLFVRILDARLTPLEARMDALDARMTKLEQELRREMHRGFADLRAEMIDFRERVERRFEALETDVGVLKTDVAALKTCFAELDGRVVDLSNDMRGLRREMVLVQTAVITTARQSACAFENTKRLGVATAASGHPVELMLEWPYAEAAT